MNLNVGQINYFHPSKEIFLQANGTCERLNGREIHLLLQRRVFINLATTSHPQGFLRGVISHVPYSPLLSRGVEFLFLHFIFESNHSLQ